VLSDFADGSCSYGKWGDGDINTAAWSYGNDASAVSAKCGNGSWTFSGTIGATSSIGANSAGFGLTLLGHVHDNATNSDVACTTFDLTAYSGFSITLTSASGAITSVGIGVDLADKSQFRVVILSGPSW
jgi:hypothetical protein